jgi:hypothetical protein
MLHGIMMALVCMLWVCPGAARCAGLMHWITEFISAGHDIMYMKPALCCLSLPRCLSLLVHDVILSALPVPAKSSLV